MSRFSLAAVAAVLYGPLVAQQPDASAGDVYPILQAANCKACHTAGGLAAATRLRFPPSGADAGQIASFERSLAPLVNAEAPEQSLLLRKPTNREKHTGGQLIPPGGKEEAALLAWIRKLAAAPAEATVAAQTQHARAAARPKLRRLTHSQYNNTVRDLLGDTTRPADRFPAEDYVNGFKNQIAAQDISPLLAEAYNVAAERLAKSAFQGGTDEQKLNSLCSTLPQRRNVPVRICPFLRVACLPETVNRGRKEPIRARLSTSS